MSKIGTFFFLALVYSCNSQNINQIQEVTALNNKAVDLIAKSYGDVIMLKEALCILDSAIKIDPSYNTAYQNKASVLCRLKRYDEAIKTLDIVVKLNKNTAEVLSSQGFILEKIGKNSEARFKYTAAFSEYEYLIKENPDKVEYQVNRAFLLAFLVDKKTAQANLEEILIKYPDNEIVNSMVSILDIFDRDQFIESFCQ